MSYKNKQASLLESTEEEERRFDWDEGGDPDRGTENNNSEPSSVKSLSFVEIVDIRKLISFYYARYKTVVKAYSVTTGQDTPDEYAAESTITAYESVKNLEDLKEYFDYIIQFYTFSRQNSKSFQPATSKMSKAVSGIKSLGKYIFGITENKKAVKFTPEMLKSLAPSIKKSSSLSAFYNSLQNFKNEIPVEILIMVTELYSEIAPDKYQEEQIKKFLESPKQFKAELEKTAQSRQKNFKNLATAVQTIKRANKKIKSAPPKKEDIPQDLDSEDALLIDYFLELEASLDEVPDDKNPLEESKKNSRLTPERINALYQRHLITHEQRKKLLDLAEDEAAQKYATQRQISKIKDPKKRKAAQQAQDQAQKEPPKITSIDDIEGYHEQIPLPSTMEDILEYLNGSEDRNNFYLKTEDTSNPISSFHPGRNKTGELVAIYPNLAGAPTASPVPYVRFEDGVIKVKKGMVGLTKDSETAKDPKKGEEVEKYPNSSIKISQPKDKEILDNFFAFVRKRISELNEAFSARIYKIIGARTDKKLTKNVMSDIIDDYLFDLDDEEEARLEEILKKQSKAVAKHIIQIYKNPSMSTQPPEEETEQAQDTQTQDKGAQPPEDDPKKENNPEYAKALEEMERLLKLQEENNVIYYGGQLIYNIQKDEEKQEIILKPAGKEFKFSASNFNNAISSGKIHTMTDQAHNTRARANELYFKIRRVTSGYQKGEYYYAGIKLKDISRENKNTPEESYVLEKEDGKTTKLDQEKLIQAKLDNELTDKKPEASKADAFDEKPEDLYVDDIGDLKFLDIEMSSVAFKKAVEWINDNKEDLSLNIAKSTSDEPEYAQIEEATFEGTVSVRFKYKIENKTDFIVFGIDKLAKRIILAKDVPSAKPPPSPELDQELDDVDDLTQQAKEQAETEEERKAAEEAARLKAEAEAAAKKAEELKKQEEEEAAKKKKAEAEAKIEAAKEEAAKVVELPQQTSSTDPESKKYIEAAKKIADRFKMLKQDGDDKIAEDIEAFLEIHDQGNTREKEEAFDLIDPIEEGKAGSVLDSIKSTIRKKKTPIPRNIYDNVKKQYIKLRAKLKELSKTAKNEKEKFINHARAFLRYYKIVNNFPKFVENTLKSKEKNKPTPKDQQLKAAENIERLLSPLVREVVRRKWQKRIM